MAQGLATCEDEEGAYEAHWLAGSLSLAQLNMRTDCDSVGITSDTQNAVNSALQSLQNEGKVDSNGNQKFLNAYATVDTSDCTVKVTKPGESGAAEELYSLQVSSGDSLLLGNPIGDSQFGGPPETKGVATVSSENRELDAAMRKALLPAKQEKLAEQIPDADDDADDGAYPGSQNGGQNAFFRL